MVAPTLGERFFAGTPTGDIIWALERYPEKDGGDPITYREKERAQRVVDEHKRTMPDARVYRILIEESK